MKNTLGASFVNDFTGSKTPIVPTPTPGKDIPTPSDGEVVVFDPTEPKEGDTPSEIDTKDKLIERPIYTIIPKSSELLQLPERTYGTIKRVGILYNQPILYGDVNLLKRGQLYYLSSAKQVYRFIKADIEYVYFTTIKPIKKDSGLSISEEERGHIRNAGYLFNEIIYSGDPNLVENGNLFYHNTLPYISIISNVDNVINLSTKEVNEEGEITTVVTEYRVSPYTDDDFKNQYLTTKIIKEKATSQAIEVSISTDGYYSLDNGNTWTTIRSDETITVRPYATILWKDFERTDDSNYGTISIDSPFNVYGNAMSLIDGENFADIDEIPNDGSFRSLFEYSQVISAKDLILPTILTSECFASMFSESSLEIAPKLPATTLTDSCYASMFVGTNITESPVLPAIKAIDGCYYQMFMDCSKLSKITAYFITDPSIMYFTANWVKNVAATGTFVKNSAATWTVPGNNGIPIGWTVETTDPEPSDEITI